MTAGARLLSARARRTAAAVAVAGLVLGTTAPAQSEAFPAVNGRIAYAQAVEDSMSSYLWTMEPDGTDRVQLTSTEGADNTPQWSPDGTQIAFQRWDGMDGQIWLIDADGTDEVQLTWMEGGASNPTWSPDGSKIVFGAAAGTGNGEALYVMDPDGSDIEQLTTDNDDDRNASWSPDGSRIAFTRNDPDTGESQIWVIDPDGSNPTQVTESNDPDVSSGSPSWSPDGTQMFFLRYVELQGTYGYVMNADGTEEHQVTPVGSWLGRWSPDGEVIALSYRDPAGDDGGIWTVRPDGSGFAPLLVGAAYDPAWQNLPAPVVPTTTTTSTPSDSSTTTTSTASGAVPVAPRYAG